MKLSVKMGDSSSVSWQFKLSCAYCGVLFLYCIRLLLAGSGLFALVLCLFLFVAVPLIFRYSYALQRTMVFLNTVRWPRNFNYSAPEKIGLLGTVNQYIKTDENVKLGVWHVLPKSVVSESKGKDALWYENQLKTGYPVVLYMHGNSGSRAATHRVDLYRVLQNLDYHVIAFDYRSYADSSDVEPSERGVVADAMYMYKWAENRTQGSPLFVWGHSLGTGVSSHALGNLVEEGKECFGLILEAPFSNFKDELRGHFLAQFFAFLPWFEACFITSPYENGFKFESDKHLSKIRAPVAILHAEDDRVVPFSLGRKLFQTLQKTRSKDANEVEFWRFESKLHHGHKFIYRDHSLPNIIGNFVKSGIKLRSKSSTQNSHS